MSIPVRARALFMVREPVIRYSLDNADRAASYHVQIGAPDDMYVADSRARPSWILADAERPIFAEGHNVRPKDGQPVAHLYVRGAAGFSDVDFVTRFRESQPGSAGEAMIGAAGVAIILTILYLADGQSELLNLIAPIVLAGVGTGSIWRGVVHSRIPFGGEMSARVSSIATVVIAVLSLFSSTLQSGVGHCLAAPLPSDCVGVTYEAFAALAFVSSHHWLLLVAAVANAALIFISWFINVHAELTLVNKGERRRWVRR